MSRTNIFVLWHYRKILQRTNGDYLPSWDVVRHVWHDRADAV